MRPGNVDTCPYVKGVGVKNFDHPCDLGLRLSWPPVKSVPIAFLEGPSEATASQMEGDEI